MAGYLLIALLSSIAIFSNSARALDGPSQHALWKVSQNKSGSQTGSNGTVQPASSTTTLNLPKIELFQTLRAKTGSAMRTTRNTTARWWRTTAEWLNPWSNSKQTSKDGGGAWFFSKRKPDPKIDTVNDFLRLERPQF